MRISSSQWFRQSLGSLLDQQTAASRTQQQLSSGKRLLKPSDDPVAAARSLDIGRAIDKLAQYQRNSVQVENRLRLQESALGSGIDALQRVRELTVQASNGTQSDDSRRVIAAEIEQLGEALMQQANTKDGSGRYLFGGWNEDKAPYMSLGGQAMPVLVDAAGTRVPGLLQADGSLAPATLDGSGQVIVDAALDPADFTPLAAGQRQIEIGFSSQVDDVEPALSVFQHGSGSARQDIIAGVQALAAILRQPVVANGTLPLPVGSQEAASFNAAMADALNGLDADIGHLSDVRTGVGTRMTRIDVQNDIQAESTLQLQTTLSSLEDVDYAEAIARLNQQLTGLQAAQQVFTKVQGLSLFNYL